MSNVIKIVNKNINSNDLDKYLREKNENDRQEKIKYLLDLLRSNPDIKEEMLNPDLRKYFGIAKREYIKEINKNSFSNKRR